MGYIFLIHKRSFKSSGNHIIPTSFIYTISCHLFSNGFFNVIMLNDWDLTLDSGKLFQYCNILCFWNSPMPYTNILEIANLIMYKRHSGQNSRWSSRVIFTEYIWTLKSPHWRLFKSSLWNLMVPLSIFQWVSRCLTLVN
jgi:hypothetical protein